MPRLLRDRAGFTLVEVLIALVLTAVLGAAVTGAFVSQSRFFDHQEKVGAARAVSRGAMNIMMSEMRMVERGGGIVSATNTRLTLRVPYALGLVCGTTTNLTIARLPADPFVISEAVFAGYAYRIGNGSYTYVEGGSAPTAGGITGTAICTAANVTVPAGGAVLQMTPTISAAFVHRPIFLYQRITYEFKASTSVSGRTGLFRQVGTATPEELVAPFDTTAKFRFYVNDAATPQTAVPGTLSQTTGIEIVLDGLSERPNGDGTFQRVPLTTSVFFRNR